MENMNSITGKWNFYDGGRRSHESVQKNPTPAPLGYRYGTVFSASYKLSKTKLLVELIDLTLQAGCLLLTSVEWVASRANLDVDLRLCGASYECVTAVAGNGSLIILWMDSFLHLVPLSAWFPTMPACVSAAECSALPRLDRLENS